MGNLLGQPFEDYVNGQISARQKVHGKKNRSTKDIQYLNSRNAWIKLASGVSIEQKRLDLLKANGNDLINNIHQGQDLAIKNVLFNGLVQVGRSSSTTKEVQTPNMEIDFTNLNLKNLYGKDTTTTQTTYNTTFNQRQRSGIKGSNRAYGVGGTDFGYSPMPGIIDMDFKCLNRGSIKKTTLNIKCHNRNQFDVIDVLYLRLGYSVFLEWGYDKYIDNNGDLKQMEDTLIDGPFWQDKFSKSDYSQWLPEIEKKRKETDGNYDGAFGTVSNFSWTFEDDGTYNIKLEIINLGDIIESLKVNLPPILPEGANPYLYSKLQSLKESDGDGDVIQSNFYGTLYPGLQDFIGRWYDERRGTPPLPSDLKRGVEAQGGEPLKFIVYQSSVYALGEYQNPQDITDEDLKIDNEDIVRALKNALQTQYFGTTSEKRNNAGKGSKFFKAFKDLGENQKHLPSKYPYYHFLYPTRANITKKTINGVTEEIINYDYTNSPKYTFSQEESTRANVNKQVISTLATTWGEAYNSLTDKLKWKMLLGNNPGESSNSENLVPNIIDKPYFLSPTKKDIQQGVYEYFKADGRAKALQVSNAERLSSELGSGAAESGLQLIKEEDEQSKAFFNSLQNTLRQDRLNKNKNRIYRFFYDFRIQNSNYLQNQINNINIDSYNVVGEELANEVNEAYKKIIVSELKKIKEDEPTNSENLKFQNQDLTTLKKSYIHIINNDKLGIGFRLDRTLERIKKVDGSKTILTIKDLAIAQFKIGNIDNQYFIRLGFFLDWLESNVLPKIDTGTPIMKFDTDQDSNICYAIDNCISANPKKLIINNDHFIKGVDENETPVAQKLYFGLNKFVVKSVAETPIYWGQIMNIYFSFSRLEEIFDSVNPENTVTLYMALKDICTDINESLGNANNIEPIVDENNVVKFIDQTPIPSIDTIAAELDIPLPKTPEKAIFQIYGYKGDQSKSNFVRKVGITTEISKNYATAITIGATSNGSVPGIEATAFSRWNIGITDRFKNNMVDANDSTTDTPSTSKVNAQILNAYAHFLNASGYDLIGLGGEGEEGKFLTYNDEIIDLNKNTISDFMKYYQAESNFKTDEEGNPINSIESSIGFLPINLKLEIDGMSGIKIYNKIEINTSFLPSNYPEALEFIITGVNHKLSNNDWVTSLETIATSKNTQTKK